jgi:hypothetical protein
MSTTMNEHNDATCADPHDAAASRVPDPDRLLT